MDLRTAVSAGHEKNGENGGDDAPAAEYELDKTNYVNRKNIIMREMKYMYQKYNYM